MRTSKLQKLWLLLVKNLRLQLRRKVVTLFEILLPVVFCAILLPLKTLFEVAVFDQPTIFPSYSVDSLHEDLIRGTFRINKRQPTNISSFSFILAYTPNRTESRELMSYVIANMSADENTLPIPVSIEALAFDSEEALLTGLSVSQLESGSTYLAGIIFSGESAGVYQNITVRMKNDLAACRGTWNTDRTYPEYVQLGPADPYNIQGPRPCYAQEGFLAIQKALFLASAQVMNPELATDDEFIDMEWLMQRFPYPPYVLDIFIVIVQFQFPLLLVLSFIFIALQIPKEIVAEKEARLRESMKMMGLSNWLHWLAWFIKYAILMAIAVGIITMLIAPPWNMPESIHVLSRSDSSLVFAFLFLYATATICFGFMVSVFFSTANVAAGAGGILFFCSYIPYFFISSSYNEMGRGTKILSCLLHNDAMAIGAYLLGKYEVAGIGAKWSNFAQPVNADDTFSMGEAMGMLLLDSLIYLTIMWYIEAIFPGEYGIPQKFYFPFQKTYWFGTSPMSNPAVDPLNTPDKDGREQRDSFFEPEPVGLVSGVNIVDLTKEYKAGRKPAVNKMNLKMYQGQITALLGHNGAGKTTTMFMLTGFIPPTRGTAYVNGYDITKDIGNVRSSLGLCPQHDILFDSLTVSEHLSFFAKLKGCTKDRVAHEIDYYLKQLDLEEKRNKFASTLSGGQKRKLSVAIALIGDSEIVILDEPTSGMDPSARRHMWTVLQSQRANRTMILSTHFMDEADHLGDRIAIMAEGVLKCCGSPIFLKSKYGAGYHLTMVKTATCDVQKVINVITKHVPDAALESHVAADLSFILPHTQVSKFEGLFKEIEDNKVELGISGYGASVTTMEEVFLKVTNGRTPSTVQKITAVVGEGTLSSNSTHEGNNQEKRSEHATVNNVASEESTKKKDTSTFLDKAVQGNTEENRLISEIERNVGEKDTTFLVEKIEPERTEEPQETVEADQDIKGAATSATGDTGAQEETEEYLELPVTEEIAKGANTSGQELPLTKTTAVAEDEGSPSLMDKVTQEKAEEQQDLTKATDLAQQTIEKYQSAFAMIPLTDDTEPAPTTNNNNGGDQAGNLAEAESILVDEPRVVHDVKRNEGVTLQLQQFKAMFIKRMINTLRKKALTISQIILPVIFAIFAGLTGTTISAYNDVAAMLLDTGNFHESIVFIQRANSSIESLGEVADRYAAITGAMDQYNVSQSISDVGESSIELYTNHYIIAATFSETNVSTLQATALYNAQPYHVAPISLSVMGNAILQSFTEYTNVSLTFTNKQLPATMETQTMTASVSSFVLSTFIMFGMAFLASSFVIFLIKERHTKVKHIQRVSGLNLANFWLSTYCWDLINYLIPAYTLIIIFAAFEVEGLYNGQWGGITMLLLTLFGVAILPHMYLLQFLFVTPATGYVLLTIYNIFVGVAPPIVISILEALEDTQTVKDNLVWFFIVIFPHYSFSMGLSELKDNYDQTKYCTVDFPELMKEDSYEDACARIDLRSHPCCKDACDISCINWQSNILSWEPLGIGKSLVFLILSAILSTLLIAAIEIGLVRRLLYCLRPKRYVSPMEYNTQEEDSDVAAEANYVQSVDAKEFCKNNSIVMSGITKLFGNFPAVDNISVVIPKEECFGLLGVNGAGKTSTFKMLTGDEAISGGTAYLNGYNVKSDIAEAQKNIGYCPQFDALIDQMTGEEIMYMYARLRGIPESQIPCVVDDLLSALALKEHAKKWTKQYSGGNKRKLSTAVALLGSPAIVFLDEPTTGVDPGARRMLWDTLTKVREAGKTLVLTSHSMEECEALCTRLAIMVNGRFKCLGSIQHLKTKYGEGYSLLARVAYPEDGSIPNLDPLKQFIEETFPGSILKDTHQNLLQYQITNTSLAWSHIFGTMERAKAEYNIEDYSVSQTTLEQVFINFARAQVPPREEVNNGCCTAFSRVCYCCIPETIVAAPAKTKHV